MALGHRLGARQVLDLVPVWNRFRYTEKMIGPLSLLLSAAAALGVDRLARGRLPGALRALVAGAGAAAAAALALTLFAPEAARALLERLAPGGGPFFLDVLRRGLPHAALGAAGLLVVDRLVPTWRAGIAATLLGISSAASVGAAVNYGNTAAHQMPTALRLPPDPAGPLRLVHPVSRELLALGELGPLDANLALRRLVLYAPLNVEARVDTFATYGAFLSRRVDALSLALGERWWEAGRRFGVTHAIMLPPLTARDERAIALAGHDGALAFERSVPSIQAWAVPHRPWAFFADGVVNAPVAAPARVAELVARGQDRTVVLETDLRPATAPDTITAISRGVEDVRIEAEASGDGLLVVNDAWAPGWHARVDGVEVPLLAADHLVRAVPFPAGRHVLDMRYDPPEVRVGWALTALGVALTLLLAALGARERSLAARRSPTSPP
jgi:hypothetical protein